VIVESSVQLVLGAIAAGDDGAVSYCSTFKVFAGKVRETGFFQKAGFPQKPFMSFAG